MSLDSPRPVRTPEWVSIHEAALLMGVSPATLRRWSDAGDIRTFTTPGGHRRFSLTAIAGLLPAVGSMPASRDQVLEEVRLRTDRMVAGGSRRIARGSTRLADDDRRDHALAEAQVRRAVDGLLGSLDAPRAGSRAAALAAGRFAAGTCGELAGMRGLGLCQAVEAWLRLRRIVLRELASAARRHDLDLATTTRWLDSASQGLDAMLMDVMRGHERAGTSLGT
jgi:excisionase family DNA binding protein